MYELTYAQAREHIKTGDVIGIDGNKLTAWAQKHGRAQWGGNRYAHYTHIGIAIWRENPNRPDGKELSIYAMVLGGNTYKALSTYAEHDMVVFRTGIDPKKIESKVDESYEKKVVYDSPSWLTIGWRMFTGLGLKNTDKAIVCSELVRLILRLCGFRLPAKFPVNPSVNEMCNALFANEMPWRIKGSGGD